MTKEPSAPAVVIVDETHKVHRKAAMYAILGDLLFIVLPLVVISIVFGLFGVNGHAQSLRFGGR